jgi:hypothetical protein
MVEPTPPSPYLQVLGDWRVDGKCCLDCGIPWDVAPDLFERGPHGCHLIRAPQTPEGIAAMVHVMWGQDLGCIRYAGHDPALLRRLGEAGAGDSCDDPRGLEWPRVFRTRALIEVRPEAPTGQIDAVRALLVGLRRHLWPSEPEELRTTRVVSNVHGATTHLRYSFEEEGTDASAAPIDLAPYSVLMTFGDPSRPERGWPYSVEFSRALKAVPWVKSAAWVTEEEWRAGVHRGTGFPL